MNGRLGAGGSEGTHGANHKVLEDEVRVGVAARVLAEVGNLAAAGLALKGTAIRTAGGIELGCRAEGAGTGGGHTAGRGPGEATREGAGRNRERRHFGKKRKKREMQQRRWR